LAADPKTGRILSRNRSEHIPDKLLAMADELIE
jgi:hypothetical protein